MLFVLPIVFPRGFVLHFHHGLRVPRSELKKFLARLAALRGPGHWGRGEGAVCVWRKPLHLLRKVQRLPSWLEGHHPTKNWISSIKAQNSITEEMITSAEPLVMRFP